MPWSPSWRTHSRPTPRDPCAYPWTVCRTIGVAVSDPRPATAPPPARIGGRYVLRAEIGRGGMATVHRAYDEVLGRQVAVKLLHGHLASDPTFLDRFRREARAAAALTHRNVVTVHDWGEDDDGAYLVLQHVDGASLREVLRRNGRLAPAQAVAVATAIADGLGAAHTAGLVHRDVKPENILIDRDGQVLLTDFGLARAAASATSTFGADVLVGSPHYLSPEAVEGETVDARSDVYALGVVLFECLTGRPPHEGDTPLATALRHAAHPVPAPSEVRPGLPRELDEVVLAATARDPAARPRDGAVLARRLRAVPVGDGGALAASTTLVLPLDTSDTLVTTAPPPATAHPEPDEVEPDLLWPDLEDAGDDEEDTPPPPRRRGWLVALLVLLLLGASAAAGFLLWDRVLAPVVPIPAVHGQPEQAATAALQEAGFVVVVADDRPFSRDVPAGHVLDQRPTGDARQGSEVVLTVSAGPRQVEVPDVTGEPHARAVETLTGEGFEVRAVEEHHLEVDSGIVIATDPPPGTVLDEGSEVTVRVSLGLPPAEVPAVQGMTVSAALEALQEVGLEGNVVERRFHDDVPAGAVISQDPGPGAELRHGDTVDLVVSDGPPPVEVPNVRGKHVEEAVATMEALGLRVRVEERGGFGAFVNPGRVYDQDPAPGARVRRGDEVILYAYRR